MQLQPAMTDRAQDRLPEEHLVAGGSERFAAREPTLAGERAGEGYGALADRFAVT